MASLSKSPRGRRPPSPRMKRMAAKKDDTFTKYIRESPRDDIVDKSTLEEIGKLFVYILVEESESNCCN